jgi:hypothetical protein
MGVSMFLAGRGILVRRMQDPHSRAIIESADRIGDDTNGTASF